MFKDPSYFEGVGFLLGHRSFLFNGLYLLNPYLKLHYSHIYLSLRMCFTLLSFNFHHVLRYISETASIAGGWYASSYSWYSTRETICGSATATASYPKTSR